MRYPIAKTHLSVSIIIVPLGICASPLGNAALLHVTLAPKNAMAREQPLKQPRRRWDSDLASHPSRGFYRHHLQVRATAYQPSDSPMEGGRWTKTERDGQSAHGVAVDPRVIPLGTRLWIPGYGHAIADDIGTAIKFTFGLIWL